MLVYSTFGKKSEAQKAAEELVERGLAACVSILPVKSIYLWKGKLEKSGETLLIIKCADRNCKKVEAALRKLNSYELPEIIAVKVGAGLPAYLEWVEGKGRKPL